MKQYQIIHTPVRFYPDIGGVNYHVLYLSKELVRLGHKVEIICADEPKSEIDNIFGIKIKRLKTWFKITNTNICFSLPLEILKSKFDIIHTHMPTPWTSDCSIILSKLMGKKSVITIHNDMDKPDFIGKLITKIYLNSFFKISLYLVDRIIIVNPLWRKSFKSTRNILDNYKNKIVVIPNGVDTTLFRPLPNIKKERNSLLFVSILDKHHKFKGLDYLLTAVKIVKKKIPDIKLRVIGEGELKQYYIDIARDLGIEKNVDFLGKKKQEELPYYYNKASVFILPSTDTEGFGISLLEAIACGIPVISTEMAGITDIIHKNNIGYIVPVRNSHILSEKITKLLENFKNKKNLKCSNQIISNLFSWKNIVNDIIPVYQ